MNNDLYQTLRNAVEAAATERGRLYEAEHEAHYIAVHVFQALTLAGYMITRQTADA